jgi:hypothetical protein
MRGLLLLAIVGAAIYALLVFTHGALTNGEAKKIYAEQTELDYTVANHLGSWDAYLPTPAVSQNPKLATSQPTPLSPQQSDDGDEDSKSQLDTQPQLAALEDKPTTAEGGSSEPQSDSVEWTKVVPAAQTHSEASVSSPTVRFYRPGAELQVVRREGIWFEVSDPATQERGWVLEQYLSSVDSPIPAQVATESTTETPTVTRPASPKSNKRHRAARPAVHNVVVANVDPWNARWARRADRPRRFGLFMFRPLPRFAQGR